MGAPVHETTITDLPDAVILRVLNMLVDVKAVRRCGAVCQKLKKLNRLVSATHFGVCHLGQPNPQDKRRTLGDIVQGCLQHGVTTADFSESLAMGSRMMSQLGDPAVVGAKPGIPFKGPASVPLIKLAQRLQHLTLANNLNLKTLNGLEVATALKHLSLRGCVQLESIEAVGPLLQLQSLDLTWCAKLSDLSPLKDHTGLKIIKLSGCEMIKTAHLEPLKSCTGLEDVNLAGLEYVGVLQLSTPAQPQPQQCWPNLRDLHLNGCSFLATLSPLPATLQTLDLSFCHSLVDTSWIEGCSRVEHLNLAHCRRLKNLDGVASCVRLKSIGLWGCSQIKSVGPLTKCRQLRVVDCTAMVMLKPRSALSMIQSCTLLERSFFDKQVANYLEKMIDAKHPAKQGSGGGMFSCCGSRKKRVAGGEENELAVVPGE